jgi:hypothetical protein
VLQREFDERLERAQTAIKNITIVFADTLADCRRRATCDAASTAADSDDDWRCVAATQT